MNTENLSTLKINKLTQAQYDRELAAGRIDENAFYLTPDEEDYLPLSGGTVTGETIFNSNIKIGGATFTYNNDIGALVISFDSVG